MKIKDLKKIKPRTSFVLFLLFFGIASLEAFRTKNWIAVGYWVLIGVMFLLLDGREKQTDYNKESYVMGPADQNQSQ